MGKYILFWSFLCCWVCCGWGDNEIFMKAERLKKQGLFKEALENYRRLLAPQKEYRLNGEELRGAIYCITQLNRINEFDDLVEKAVAAHPESTPLYLAAAQAYSSVTHDGFFSGNKFQRGYAYGRMPEGRYVNAFSRDRVRALQLYAKTVDLINNPWEPGNNVSLLNCYKEYGNAMRHCDQAGNAWKLQYLTDLSKLPDYDDQRTFYQRGYNQIGAPVNSDGTPVVYSLPKSLDSAVNDGERWRWLLQKINESGGGDYAKKQWADFLLSQFGVRTATGHMRDGSGFPLETGRQLKELGDGETIARLANGIRRFKLADEFNYIKIYRELADRNDRDARSQLIAIYLNRCQYNRAVELLKSWKDTKNTEKQLENITADRGFLLPLDMQPAGKRAMVRFKYRNADKAVFSLQKINVRKLLDEMKGMLKDNPLQIQHRQIDLASIGYDMVWEKRTGCLGDEVAKWEVKLTPGNEHYDRITDIAMPEVPASAYLLKAELPDGYKCFSVLWLTDTVLLRKNMDDKIMYYAADAATGQPVSNAKFKFFGYRQQMLETPETVPGSKEKRRYNVVCREFESLADRDGMVFCDEKQMAGDFQWMVEVADDNSRLGVMGFAGVWFRSRDDYEYSARKIYCLTDRPVYRPGQKVFFNAWGAWASYARNGGNPFAGADMHVEIVDPRNQKVMNKLFKADIFGGINGDLVLPEKATLGVYTIRVDGLGFCSFRVEEYKKPEFEVKVNVPKEPLQPGAAFKVGINAAYYWGAPVVNGVLKYKIERSRLADYWFPPGPWDWLYGPGYWWPGTTCRWWPDWNEWGCAPPLPPWLPDYRVSQPELVASGEAVLDHNGNYEITIDTDGLLKKYGNVDSRYQVSAEVVDDSRRMISGEGSVIAAAKPFNVYCWPNRGFYAAGDTARFQVVARTVDGIPVSCKGQAMLYLVGYDRNGKPEEQLVSTVDVDGKMPENGLKFRLDKPGQYRLSCVLDDGKNKVEGGYLFLVMGDREKGQENLNVRFNPLELTCDRQEYKPGDSANLLITAEKADSTVLLIVHSSKNPTPEVLRLTGKSLVKEIKIESGDMPNFFIEAYTVADGKVHQAVSQVVVPPEKKVLNLDVVPVSRRLSPGEEAVCKLKVTDQRGAPVSGSLVVTVYDRSLEYVAPGNYPDIRKFFWDWLRFPQSDYLSSTLTFHNLLPKGVPYMGALGCFGYLTPLLSGDPIDPALLADIVPHGTVFAKRAMGVEMEDAGALSPGGMNMMPMAAPACKAESALAGGAASPPPVAIRSFFADSAFWTAKLVADKDGIAEIKFKMPDNLTAWKIRAWTMSSNACVGQGEAEIITAKDFMVRLQIPRFLTGNDRACFSAIVHNYLDTDKETAISLELSGNALRLCSQTEVKTKIAKNGEARIDWLADAVNEGIAGITVRAVAGDGVGDAMKLEIPVYVHGMRQQISKCGSISADGGKNTAVIEFDVPPALRREETRMQLNYSPSVAVAILDALPYLAAYPYGCTEQTLNRFLPAVIVRKTLRDLDLTLPQLADKGNNLNPGELGLPQERAAQWQRWKDNPVFEEKNLDKMVADGVRRLSQMQLADGGWGWFSGAGESSGVHTTALVMRGLLRAQSAGLYIDGIMLKNGLEWLSRYQAEQLRLLDNVKEANDNCKLYADNLDAMVFMVLVEGRVRSDKIEKMRKYLFRDRLLLSVYGQILLAQALQTLGEQGDLHQVMQCIREYQESSREEQTAWLNMGKGNYWWRWSGNRIEAMACYLQLLCRIGGKENMAVASGLAKYLVNNRKHASYWNSTRDTAFCVEAICEYLKKSGEFEPNMALNITVDGKLKKKITINKGNIFSFDSSLILTGAELGPGKHRIELFREGTGPVFYNAFLSYFTLEKNIPPAGVEVKVTRNYYLVKERPRTVQVATQNAAAGFARRFDVERVKLEPPFKFNSGDVVEVELVVENQNDYEYIMVEDYKPAGMEAMEMRSGYSTQSPGVYIEYRDRVVGLFLSTLPQGRHSMTYRLRAEIPGSFSALPARVEAMYAPELQGNSAEAQIRISETARGK